MQRPSATEPSSRAPVPRAPVHRAPVPRVDEVTFVDLVGHWKDDDAVEMRRLEVAEADDGRRSFDRFYRRARPSIGRALALALGDVDLAVDATDEALARAYERWSKVSTLERPEGWVYRVGLNWATSVLRRRRNHQRLYAVLPVESPVITDPAVHASIAELDIAHRSVVVCRHLLGWSVSETAAALRIREGTVKSRLHRATRILQTRLQHLDPTKPNES